MYRLATLIAGKSIQQTTALLLGQLGMRMVSLSLARPEQGRLPPSPQQIHLVVVETTQAGQS